MDLTRLNSDWQGRKLGLMRAEQHLATSMHLVHGNERSTASSYWRF
jgi:hypothetical protein